MRGLLAILIVVVGVACDAPAADKGSDAGAADVQVAALDGYEGTLPVGDLVDIELGAGRLVSVGAGVEAQFAALESGRKVFAQCSDAGCPLELLGRVAEGVADGARWEVDLIGQDGERRAFQQGDSRWQLATDGKDYQVASFYFGTRAEYDAIAGPGSVTLRLVRAGGAGAEELIGFVSVSVAFEAIDGQ